MIRSRIVTLTTDFGLSSGYVGSLRGVLLSTFPGAVLADITHQVTPYDIGEGALVLRASVPTFPAGTVHLAVVDPGVGGDRRPMILEAGGHLFVGPDNGLFTPFLDGPFLAWEIDADRAARGPMSPTFHGRDLFAPVAARLAAGEESSRMGRELRQPVRLDWPRPDREPRRLAGAILHVDGFGNLISNIPGEWLPVDSEGFALRIGDQVIETLVSTYAEAPAGRLVALVGSSGLLEVAVAQGHAARRLGLGPGAPIDILWDDPPDRASASGR